MFSRGGQSVGNDDSDTLKQSIGTNILPQVRITVTNCCLLEYEEKACTLPGTVTPTVYVCTLYIRMDMQMDDTLKIATRYNVHV